MEMPIPRNPRGARQLLSSVAGNFRLTGQSSATPAPTVNSDYRNEHLRFISREAGPDVQVVLVLDQAGWHMANGLTRREIGGIETARNGPMALKQSKRRPPRPPTTNYGD
jgi:hypothetical protein